MVHFVNAAAHLLDNSNVCQIDSGGNVLGVCRLHNSKQPQDTVHGNWGSKDGKKPLLWTCGFNVLGFRIPYCQRF